MIEKNNNERTYLANEDPNKRRYGYLFQTTSLRPIRLSRLISTKAFINAADSVRKSGRTIDDIEVYNIAKSLFFPMHKQHLREDFKEKYKLEYGRDAYREWSQLYHIFGSATRAFSVDLFGTEEYWKSEFEVFMATDPE